MKSLSGLIRIALGRFYGRNEFLAINMTLVNETRSNGKPHSNAAGQNGSVTAINRIIQGKYDHLLFIIDCCPCLTTASM